MEKMALLGKDGLVLQKIKRREREKLDDLIRKTKDQTKKENQNLGSIK